MTRTERTLWIVVAAAGWLVAAGLFALVWRQGGLFTAPQAAPAAGNRILCPVCHAVVADPSASPKATVRGVDYWFCPAAPGSPSHQELFLADPDHYLNGAPPIARDLTPMAGAAPAPASPSAASHSRIIMHKAGQPAADGGER